MLVRSAEESFRKGMQALHEAQTVKALAMFEAALKLEQKFRGARPQPRYLSYYGLCLGLEGTRLKEAIELCREAVAAESYNADLHLNLARVLLAAGRRRDGWEMLQKGLRLEPRHEGERIRSEDGTVRRGEDLDAVGDGGRGHARAASSNCSSSVEPFSASVEAWPPLTAVAIASNQPAPTSRWWRVAVYPCSSRANSCSWRRT